jgi:hypothetical protein
MTQGVKAPVRVSTCFDCGTFITRSARKGRCPSCYNASRGGQTTYDAARLGSESLLAAYQRYFEGVAR